MVAPMTADLVEEPRSGMLVPSELQEADDAMPKELLGIGLRVKRIMGMEEGSTLASALFASPAEKVICLTFLRSLPAHKVADSFKETLHQDLGVPMDVVAAFTRTLAPSFVRGTELRLRVRTLLSEVVVSGEWLEEGVPIHSPDLCRGFQAIIYGARPLVTGLEESLQSQREVFQRASRLRGSLGLEASGLSSDDQRSSGAETPERCPDSPERAGGSFRSPGGLPSIRSEGVLVDALAAVPPLPGQEPSEEVSSAANPQEEEEDALPRRKRSWKARSGREGGGDGYRFGDFTRTVVHKTRERMGSGSSSSRRSFTSSLESWPGPLVAEGEEAPWVSADSVPHLDAAELAGQRLSAALYKHHTSPVRGHLVPQWSLRYFELRAGTLHYRRRKDGAVKGSFSLDGAWVVVEPPKACRMGDCFVFRLATDAGLLCRLSCSDRDVATSFALAAAAACAHYRARRSSDDQHPAASEAKGEPEGKAASEASSTPERHVAADEKAGLESAAAGDESSPLHAAQAEAGAKAEADRAGAATGPSRLSVPDSPDQKALEARGHSPISLSGHDPRWAPPASPGASAPTTPAAPVVLAVSSAPSARALAAAASFLVGAFGVARRTRGRRSLPAFLLALLLLLPTLAARRRSAARLPRRLLGPAQ